MLTIDNKYSYFSIKIASLIKEKQKDPSETDDLLEMIDLIFIAMNVNDEWYSFLSNDKHKYIYLFRCETRKRLGQLRRLCEKYVPSGETFSIVGYDKVRFQAKLRELQSSYEWIPVKQVRHYQEFIQQDSELTTFEKSEQWFPWQKEMYNLIFDQDNTIKKADDRKIISIIDRDGKKGKSSFLKWICHSNSKDFLKLGYGSASQLRAVIINNGPKRCYFIDLARTEANDDKMVKLMSVIKEVKNGHVMNTLYRRGESLIMPHPHIFIFSNKPLKYNFLSKDQWQIYQISDDLELKSLDITSATNAKMVSKKRSEVILSKMKVLSKRQIRSLIFYLILRFIVMLYIILLE